MTKINLLLASTPTHATLINGAEDGCFATGFVHDFCDGFVPKEIINLWKDLEVEVQEETDSFYFEYILSDTQILEVATYMVQNSKPSYKEWKEKMQKNFSDAEEFAGALKGMTLEGYLEKV